MSARAAAAVDVVWAGAGASWVFEVLGAGLISPLWAWLVDMSWAGEAELVEGIL